MLGGYNGVQEHSFSNLDIGYKSNFSHDCWCVVPGSSVTRGSLSFY